MRELTPIKAIRLKCLDCCCGSAPEVAKCHLEDCSLHPYRFGRRPSSSKRDISEFRGYNPSTMKPRAFDRASAVKGDDDE